MHSIEKASTANPQSALEAKASQSGRASFCIAVIPGDGVGQEVVPAALAVLKAVGAQFDVQFQCKNYDWGAEYYFQHHCMMPSDGLDVLRTADAILLGAIGHPRLPDDVTLNGLLLPIRRAFDQFVNLRPATLYRGIRSPLRGIRSREIDMVLVRENTEGEYAQVGGFVHHHHPSEVAVQASVFTKQGVERVIRFAFELALKRNGKRRITSITKSNAQGFGMVLWDRVFDTISPEYPQIETESLLVDAAAMKFVRQPGSFDVVVASNLFGDILSDLSAAITGSIGLAPSANLDPLRRFPSMFEPVHGSAPDIAGKGIANPIATVLSVAMMLEHLQLGQLACRLYTAVEEVLKEGRVKTPDLGGKNSTQEVTHEIIRKIETLGGTSSGG